MGERLFGVETEYAVSAFDADGDRVEGGYVTTQLLKLAKTRLVCLPGTQSSGVFLANASRLYVDAGEHVEVSTPECTTPWEGVRYTLVSDRILADLAAELVATDAEIGEIVLTRCNVDYSGSGSTWGCHESYLYRENPEVVAREIIPHFVSRLIYTGAGGFDNCSSGARFLLSPRVAHLLTERSRTSTSERGIFHYKDESLSGGDFHRLHVLCGESSCSRLAAWLKLGTTALVVALIDAGVRPGQAVRLGSPVEAMHAFARDPECRVEAVLQDGRMLSAIAIQRYYLGQVEEHLGESFMPPWAGEVCRVWRATLNDLEQGPSAVATKLDWAIKLTLFRRHAERRGFDWASLPHWTYVADELAEAVTESGFSGPSITAEEALRHTRSPVPETVQRLTIFLGEHGLVWDGIRPFLDFKKELCEIDTRFSQLGDRGIFQALDRAGVLDHDGPGVGDLDGALETPPASGRARLRGEAIRTLARRRQTSTADWHGVWDRKRKRMLDLSNPFAEVAEWQPWAVDSELDVPSFLRR
jgi:hypothetical protein